ncbi:MAG: type II toxin-antitoxin system Phd/YefM family antitoxin [Euzebyaceae bacterium]|nr:type II toxin-antitoxin system Phd/YefM family antitoxin [Euzebyaceae bacterium]
MTTWTMSDARQRFHALLDRVASGQSIQITRHGEVAAVVVAPRDFERLKVDAGTFAEALRRFRATTDATDLLIDELEGLRDPAAGRPITL